MNKKQVSFFLQNKDLKLIEMELTRLLGTTKLLLAVNG